MFDRVMEWLASDPNEGGEGFNDSEVRLSVAALFYHMIAVDGSVSTVESDRLRTLLQHEFGLDDEQIEKLAEAGQHADQNSSGVFPFSVVLNEELDLTARQRIYAELETLAMADGILHDLEAQLLSHMKVMLKLDQA